MGCAILVSLQQWAHRPASARILTSPGFERNRDITPINQRFLEAASMTLRGVSPRFHKCSGLELGSLVVNSVSYYIVSYYRGGKKNLPDRPAAPAALSDWDC